MAAKKPTIIATPAHRSGHGIELRTVMLGALMVNRRRMSFQRMS